MSQAYRIFADYVIANKLKFTLQRRRIVEVFLRQDGHLRMEELYDKVRAEDPSIGQATVYRTLKLLCGAGLAKEVNFGDGASRYEVLMDHEHHDHLICISCGKRVEAVDSDIEKLQEALARRNGFQLTSHQMYLYGICADCRRSKQKG